MGIRFKDTRLGASGLAIALLAGCLPSGEATVASTIPNAVPVAVDATLRAPRTTAVDGTLVATDDDDDATLTYELVAEPTKGSVELSTTTPGAYTYQADPGASGVDTFTFRASDGIDASDPATVTVTIYDQEPVAAQITPSAFNEDVQSGLITLSYEDGDDDPATTCTISNLDNVAVSQACACVFGVCQVRVTGVSNFNGTAGFDYTVTANSVVSNVAHATLTITAVDDAPVATAITPAAFNTGVPTAITLAYTDAESDAAATCAVSGLTNVTLSTACTCASGTCTAGVTSTTDYFGAGSFTYTVTANGVVSNSATATLSVLPTVVSSNLTWNHEAAFSNGGTGPTPSGCSGDWYDLTIPLDQNDYFLNVQNGCSPGSGWVGNGTVAQPYAYQYNATDQLWHYRDYDSLPGANATIEMWMRPDTASGTVNGYLGDWDSSDYLMYDLGAGLVFRTRSGDELGPVTHAAGEWFHLVITSTGEIYKNGTLIENAANLTMTYNAFYDPQLGYAYDWDSSTDYFMNGRVAIFRGYSTAFNAAKVKRNCHALAAQYGVTCAP